MAARTKLDYAPRADAGRASPSHGPFARASLVLVPFAVMVDAALYGAADASGRQAFLGPAALLVLGLGLLGSILAVIGLLHRGHRKAVAAISLVLHGAVAGGFVFALGLLA